MTKTIASSTKESMGFANSLFLFLKMLTPPVPLLLRDKKRFVKEKINIFFLA